MNTSERFLTRLGLNQHQSRIYLALLTGGPARITEISRRSGCFRQTIYQELPKLIAQELVVVRPKGRGRMYEAASPRQLEKQFRELEKTFDEELTALERIAGQANAVDRPKVTYYEGKKAIIGIHRDVIETLPRGGTQYRYSSANIFSSRWEEGFYPQFLKTLRDEKDIQRFVITNAPNRARKKPSLGRIIKVVPPDFDPFAYNVTQIIYGNKVAIIDYESRTGIVIEHEQFSKFQEKIFRLLYKKL